MIFTNNMINYNIKKIQERLDRIRKNEHGMTPFQRIQYRDALKELKRGVYGECVRLLEDFISGDLWVLDSDQAGEDSVIRRAAMASEDPAWKSLVQKICSALVETYDIGKTLEAACRVRTEIMYRAYSSYWASRSVYDDHVGKYTNMILNALYGGEFYYDAGAGQWEDAKRRIGVGALPPTMELIEVWYREEMNLYDRDESGESD